MMTLNYNHPYHLVTQSPWPIIYSLSLMDLLINFTFLMWKEPNHWSISFILLMMCFFQWMRDITRESTFQGFHNKLVVNGLKLGFIIFILSEIFLFISLFWMLMHLSLSPSPFLGNTWPPLNITQFNPLGIPLLNTALLLSSGVFITWSHYSLLSNNKEDCLMSMMLTISCGLVFLMIQIIEYKTSSFTISDSVYGSAFFLITGFHGLHVVIGCLFLMVSTVRIFTNHISSHHHFNFESSAWYWHFVDIIWILVYSLLYF